MKRILLLEDDITLGETIQELLIQNSYKVDYVINHNDAIDFSYDNRYNYIYLI